MSVFQLEISVFQIKISVFQKQLPEFLNITDIFLK